MKKEQGFTLIELMVAVVVLGILSAIAIPAYGNYVVRSKLSQVGVALADARLRQEQFFADNRNYGIAGGACGAIQGVNDYFTLNCVVGGTNQTYVITAASRADEGLGAVGDYTYTINEIGAQATTQYAGTAVALTEWRTR